MVNKDELSPPAAADLDREETALGEVRRAIRAIEFGSILIKIHGGEVVGIETSKKVRLDPGTPKS